MKKVEILKKYLRTIEGNDLICDSISELEPLEDKAFHDFVTMCKFIAEPLLNIQDKKRAEALECYFKDAVNCYAYDCFISGINFVMELLGNGTVFKVDLPSE